MSKVYGKGEKHIWKKEKKGMVAVAFSSLDI
jgi:hypothetical protein